MGCFSSSLQCLYGSLMDKAKCQIGISGISGWHSQRSFQIIPAAAGADWSTNCWGLSGATKKHVDRLWSFSKVTAIIGRNWGSMCLFFIYNCIFTLFIHQSPQSTSTFPENFCHSLLQSMLLALFNSTPLLLPIIPCR